LGQKISIAARRKRRRAAPFFAGGALRAVSAHPNRRYRLPALEPIRPPPVDGGQREDIFMKRIIPTVLAAVLISGSAYAQSINLGPGGVSIDPRSPRERAIDREERREMRMRERERAERRADRREWRAERRGRDCRTITTREETPRGVVRRETRVCD
jgi:hypothetical protein